MEKKHPWTAPGTAPILGEGCGANGGNPQGCWEDDPLPYGHCCKYQGINSIALLNICANDSLSTVQKCQLIFNKDIELNPRTNVGETMPMVNLPWSMLQRDSSLMLLSQLGGVESLPQ